jgi:S-adenosylmethionine:tRNA ribosyltransferase-isomerase
VRTALYDYALPPGLIAQEPRPERARARMLVAPPDGALQHRHVADLPELLRPGDLLVLNATRVIPARLLGRKPSGGALEVLLMHAEPASPTPAPSRPPPVPGGDADAGERWRALVRGKVTAGTVIELAGGSCTVDALHDDGTRTVAFPAGVDVLALLDAIGHVPLPPYIARADVVADRERYQTVFARLPGSVAAPTAGLHIDQPLLARLRASGVAIAEVELAIGPGTFKPVDTDQVDDFRIHQERCACPQAAVDAVAACRARGGRVIAVGTTVLRTLETAARQPGGFAAFAGWTGLFLRPPQRLRVVEGLLTNFHMPRSSLLMAVSCLTGRRRLLAWYAAAIAGEYRFLSYGDCMLALPRR